MRALARHLPLSVQRAIRLVLAPRAAVQRHLIIRRLRSQPHLMPDRETLRRLCAAWGGGGVGTADLELEACRRARAATRPILECGSGLSTILMGIYAQEPIFSLEESAAWCSRMKAALKWYRIDGVHIIRCPIVSYDGFDWFAVPSDLPRQFDLVFVDGPEAHKRPGLPRYGVAEVMASALDDDTVLILDDAERPGEAETLERWRELGFAQQRLHGEERRYAVVAR